MTGDLSVTISALSSEGVGIAKVDGYTLFVDGALPDEVVRVRITERRKKFGYAELLSIEKKSYNRVVPICPLFGTCGGCQVMHLQYEKQLEMKTKRVEDALNRIGKLEVTVEPCIGSKNRLHYRNKVDFQVEDDRFGFFKKKSNEIVEVETCYIHNEMGNTLFQSLKGIKGLSKLIVKTSVRKKEQLVVLVSDHTMQMVAKKIVDEHPAVKTVIQTRDQKRFKTLEGPGFILEELLGYTFKISAASFFQVNLFQAEALYEKVIELANLSKSERVVDAYCGVGTLSLLLSENAKEVIGIESVPEAVKDAKDNARRNGVTKASFITGKAETCIQKIESIDLLILNPPRGGCHPALLKSVTRTKPKTVIYVSCDPATLARDLRVLAHSGYRIDTVQPFDMFCQTAHVETVVKLLL